LIKAKKHFHHRGYAAQRTLGKAKSNITTEAALHKEHWEKQKSNITTEAALHRDH
jgi:hypothetical protein